MQLNETFKMRLSSAMREKLEALAKAEGRSLGDVVRRLLEKSLEARGE